MRTRAAIFSKVNEPLTIDEIEIEQPKFGEVLVRMVASGVCHTDASVMHGIVPVPLPAILGHEGAGSSRRSAREYEAHDGRSCCGRSRPTLRAVSIVSRGEAVLLPRLFGSRLRRRNARRYETL
jgi:hypothetical protein